MEMPEWGWGVGKQGSHSVSSRPRQKGSGQASGSSGFGDTAAALGSWETGLTREAGRPGLAVSSGHPLGGSFLP